MLQWAIDEGKSFGTKLTCKNIYNAFLSVPRNGLFDLCFPCLLGKGIESISLEGGDNVSPSDSAIMRMVASRRGLQYINLLAEPCALRYDQGLNSESSKLGYCM